MSEPTMPTGAQEATPQDTEAEVSSERLVGSRRTAWGRLLRGARPRPTKGNMLGALLAIALGFALVVQVRQTSNQGLEGLRENDLVRLLDTVTQDSDRLTTEIARLEAQRNDLASTTDLEQARIAAQQRLDSLGILAGTTPAYGPGIVMTIRDPETRYTAAMLLDALQELRDAGAEAIQINDLRITANSWFADGDDRAVRVDGSRLTRPFVVTAIGDANTLAGAMEIPGGVSESARRVGGDTLIVTHDRVEVTALRSLSSPRYAQPEASPSPAK